MCIEVCGNMHATRHFHSEREKRKFMVVFKVQSRREKATLLWSWQIISLMPVFSKGQRQRQRHDNTAITLAILLSWKTMEAL